MRVAVIGLGSMGKRRIRLIKQIDENIEIIGVDLNEDRREETESKFNIQTVDSIEALPEGVSAAFVSTSPLSHAAIIKQCLMRRMNVFTELNLVSDGYDENMMLAQNKGCVLFLSSTFLYREEITHIRKVVAASSCALNYCYHIGQYLPDWHPWESYKSFFVGNKRTNGCREIMAIELPWLTRTFGPVKRFTVIADKISSLDIDYPDNYLLQIEHESGAKGTLTIDVVSRKAVRNLELYGENLYVSWNGSPNGLYQYDYESKKDNIVELYDVIDKQEGYSSFVIENAYKNEILAFFKQIKDGTEPVYGFSDDKIVLNLIDRIEAEGQKR